MTGQYKRTSVRYREFGMKLSGTVHNKGVFAVTDKNTISLIE